MASATKPPRILFAEDEELIQLVAATELTEAGYEVVEVASGDAGLSVLRDDPAFDILLTDIRMPGETDGWELAEAARLLNPDIAVVYATGYSAVALRPVPDAVFVGKPYRAPVLLAAIASLLTKGASGPRNIE
jgi:CheY-like chemotaxis protein